MVWVPLETVICTSAAWTAAEINRKADRPIIDLEAEMQLRIIARTKRRILQFAVKQKFNPIISFSRLFDLCPRTCQSLLSTRGGRGCAYWYGQV